MDSLSVLIKVTVADVSAAKSWYEEKLGFKVLFQYKDIWVRMEIPGYENVTYGLAKDDHTKNSGGEVTTMIVSDIDAAKKDLEAKGVTVGPIIEPGAGVKLAFFSDLDGNSLGLRQESTTKS